MSSLSLIRHIAYQLFAPSKHLKRTYRAFRDLLGIDYRCHELLTLLEGYYHEKKGRDFCAVLRTYDGLSHAVSRMIRHLDAMAPRSYRKLRPLFREIDSAVRSSGLKFPSPDSSLPLVLSLEEISTYPEIIGGGKASHLSKIAVDLRLPVPSGFVITSRAFEYFCEANHLQRRIETSLAEVDVDSPSSLEAASASLTSLFLEAPMPADLGKAIWDACARLPVQGNPLDGGGVRRWALRSSASGEDAALSFAGQFKTVLNIGPDRLGHAYKEVIAGKYSANALFYRIKNGFLDQETPMAVLVLEMIDAGSSGIVYSRSPLLSGHPLVTVYSVWGLGELLVKGAAVPDVIEVSGRDDPPKVIRKKLGTRETKMVLSHRGNLEHAALETHEKEQMSLGDDDALRLAKWAVQLESHSGSPQDIEWCKDREGNLYLLQARPLHRELEIEPSCQTDSSKIPNPVLLSGGERAASGIGSGRVVLASSPDDLKDIPGETVLVAHAPFPKWAQVMDRLSAVVTDLGSVAGHFASVAREWGVPTLVSTRVATKTLRPGETVTVDADNMRVYAGRLQGVSNLPCAQRGLPQNSPFMNRLRSILDRASPLNLLNPQDPGFAPEGCKTLHDIVRFVHEKAVQEMFSLGGASMRRARGAKKLKSEIPITLYVLDLGDTRSRRLSHKEIEFTDIKNPGLRALWKGLGHPEILWSPDILHFDWQEFDRLSAGIISLDSQLLASFAVISEDYLNINIRFGYHFVVIDAVFAPVSRNNYISLRFKGGGGTPDKRHLRVRFLAQVLGKHGFETYFEGDTIDAKLQGTSPLETEKEMEMLGFLLGFTRLLDQKLDDMSSVEVFAGEFLEKFPPN